MAESSSRRPLMPAAPPTRLPAYFAGALFLAVLVALGLYYGPALTRTYAEVDPTVYKGKPRTSFDRYLADDPPGKDRVAAPDLAGGTAWLNTAGPVKIADLKGKIVLLDFWTLCCINCIHTLPDLAKLEKKYPNQLVVIGVHSAKFENEKNSESIRKAILRYEIGHPVVNDANMKIWRAYAVNSWPTLYLIDPQGKLVGRGSGEGLYEALDEAIAKLIKEHRQKKTLNEQPLRFDLAR